MQDNASPANSRARTELLAVIEGYFDAVPRSSARVEDLGPFTLFVKVRAGWPYYARPRLGAAVFTADEVHQVRARQRELDVPETFEWVAETSPRLRVAVEEAGLEVADHPLLALDPTAARRVPAPPDVEVRLVTPDDDLALLGAVPRLAFASPGTAIGTGGPDDLAALVAERRAEEVEFERDRVRTGRTVMVVALVADRPVGVGMHQPVDSTTEVVGVGVLPAYRRRGIAASLTAALLEDAQGRGVETIFLSAGDEVIARVYGRVGFRRIGTACTAEPVPAELF